MPEKHWSDAYRAIWHALWELGPKKFPCYCARCQPTIGMNK